MVEKTFNINDLQHPIYKVLLPDWRKYRLTFRGGTEFIDEYLEQFSKGEDDDDFTARKKITYCPAFSKASVIEVKNSIYQRMVDITRRGGPKSYQEACVGRQNGVDLLNSTMNVFMGTEVLPELLSMGKVGIYIDMQPRRGETIADNVGIRPYVYVYKAEQIRSWTIDQRSEPNQYKSVLLKDTIYIYDEETGLPEGEMEIYRFFYKKDGQVFVRLYNNKSRKVDIYGNIWEVSEDILLEKLTRIPFICLEMEESLLVDIADYQIALLNLASSDMAYAVGANFPFYTEQFDPRLQSPHLKTNIQAGQEALDTDADLATKAPAENINVGPTSGRKYPINTERPAFIHPSPEPMKASMAKQEQLKLEIRLLINLAISNIQPKMASAESKGMDERTLESGLSYIGLLLEDAERQIAVIWAEYEGDNSIATINYPEQYDLRSDEDRRKEAAELRKLLAEIPSDRYQREIAKYIAKIMVGPRITYEDLQKIYKEIDAAKIVNVNPEKILDHVEGGLLDPEAASKALGYPEGSVDKAQKFQAERLALIQKAQTPPGTNGNNPAARGNPDASPIPAAAAELEKEGKEGRGPAKE